MGEGPPGRGGKRRGGERKGIEEGRGGKGRGRAVPRNENPGYGLGTVSKLITVGGFSPLSSPCRGAGVTPNDCAGAETGSMSK